MPLFNKALRHILSTQTVSSPSTQVSQVFRFFFISASTICRVLHYTQPMLPLWGGDVNNNWQHRSLIYSDTGKDARFHPISVVNYKHKWHTKSRNDPLWKKKKKSKQNKQKSHTQKKNPNKQKNKTKTQTNNAQPNNKQAETKLITQKAIKAFQSHLLCLHELKHLLLGQLILGKYILQSSLYHYCYN